MSTIIEAIPLDKHLSDFIQKNISLHDKNWFRTGGSAQAFAAPQTASQFHTALQYAHMERLPVFVLGDGANILINDDGFAGLVIKPQLTTINHEVYADYALVHAGAGSTIHDLIVYCLDHNLLGLEEFSGIPGTVGGSVYINLHYFEFLLSQFIEYATIIDAAGELHNVDADWFNFGYNHSRLHEEKYYVVDATFRVRAASLDEIFYARGRMHEIIRHRQRRYPKEGTCGSFFRSFLDEELVQSSYKITFVGYYLDKVGVKGTLSNGGACVSYQHANMIVNTGQATSADIIAVARSMQKRVYEQFGLLPQPECQLVGFLEYPLYTYETVSYGK